MKTTSGLRKTLLSLSLATVFISGCASAPKAPDGAAAVRQQLTQLQADPQLALLAPLAIKEAERAILVAEQPEKNSALAAHRVTMAERKVTLASTQAKTRWLEQQRAQLSQQRDDIRLNARTREAERAQADARNARTDASGARSESELARRQAIVAENREQMALSDARAERQRADRADAASQSLRDEVAELNARPTDRGLVVTLGDVLFDTAKAELKLGSDNHLDKLAQFLNTYPERTAQIEGHTDDIGSDAANMLLSQRRADTVKAFLVAQGIAASRLSAMGKGEGEPLAANTSADARAQNRRVEVIIAKSQE